MKNVLIIGLCAILLFSLSAALSLWLNSARKPKTDDTTKVVPRESEEREGSRPRPDTTPSLKPQIPPTTSNLSAEDMSLLLSKMKERSAAIDRREQDMKKQEQQLRLFMEDLRSERTALDGLRKQVSDELKAATERLAAAERRLAELEETRRDVTRTRADLQRRQTEIDTAERGGIDKIATISDSMAPESAALIIKQLADSGKMDTAVKLLGQMRERRAAQVLAEMNDAPLAAQLLDRLKSLRKPTPGTTPPAGGV